MNPVELCFEVSGSGNIPLVCVHGWACDGSQFTGLGDFSKKTFVSFASTCRAMAARRWTEGILLVLEIAVTIITFAPVSASDNWSLIQPPGPRPQLSRR
jgi:hypothetical protein